MKKISVFFVGVALVSLGFTSCGNSAPAEATTEEVATEVVEEAAPAVDTTVAVVDTTVAVAQ